MLFKDFAIALQDIESVSSRLAITEKLAALFTRLSADEIGTIPYLLQGRISPAYTGVEFGVAEKSVIKAAALALARDPKDFAQTVRSIGDLGTAIEQERATYQSFDQRDLDLAQVFIVFEQVAAATGVGSQETKASLLGSLFTALDPLSCRYIARIPLAQLRLGASDITIMDALSWMECGGKSLRPQIEKAYQVRPDLSLICRQVKEQGVSSLGSIGPSVGTPILMMRAERLSSGAEIIEKLGECILEPKYDGLRLQVHVSKSPKSKVKSQKATATSHPEVRIFTRGLEDATHMYPDIVQAVLTELDCDEVIIEGEALGYDFEKKSFLPFQVTTQRKRKHDVAETARKIPLRLMVFDILYRDGESTINLPLVERRRILESLIDLDTAHDTDTITLAPSEQTADAACIESKFDSYVTAGLEGIMAKKLDGIYKPGAREYSWVKLKRSYSEKVNDTIDCVVMGYDMGKGKRADFGIGAILVGVCDPETQQYKTVAKIGTGMTDDEWRQLKVLGEQHVALTQPQEYDVLKIMYPDVWMRPVVVIEVRCDELTTSQMHTSGWGLRFPRLERFRTDKLATDATTVTELSQIVLVK